MSQVKKFYAILKAEFLDAEEDLEQLLGVYAAKEEKGEITPYVYKSNAAVFRKEISSIAEIIHEMDCCAGDQAPTMDAAERTLLELIDQAVKEFDFPQAVKALCLRKIQKVRTYLTTT